MRFELMAELLIVGRLARKVTCLPTLASRRTGRELFASGTEWIEPGKAARAIARMLCDGWLVPEY